MKFICELLLLYLIVALRCEASSLNSKKWGIRKSITTNTTARLSNYTIPDWKRILPQPLPNRRTLERIHIPLTSVTQVTVYLLGTSHVSNNSSLDVRLLLQAAKPQVVFLELCDQRINMLVPSTDEHRFAPNESFWERVSILQEASVRSKASAMGTILLKQVQDDYADSLGVELGDEFRTAWDYCQNYHPICNFGDRILKITLVRAWESLSWWGKFKYMVALIWSSLQKPNPQELREWMNSTLVGDSDVLTENMAELRRYFPTLERVILKEQDTYLACKIFQTCRYLNPKQNHTMVAIVGAGHCKGICEWLTEGNG
jgi:pheromone shutdown protein TraB